jgi:hypothetical protein
MPYFADAAPSGWLAALGRIAEMRPAMLHDVIGVLFSGGLSEDRSRPAFKPRPSDTGFVKARSNPPLRIVAKVGRSCTWASRTAPGGNEASVTRKSRASTVAKRGRPIVTGTTRVDMAGMAPSVYQEVPVHRLVSAFCTRLSSLTP